MQSSSFETRPDKSRHVCRLCKTRKRKCDKGLPKCSSCLKKNSICDYAGLEENHQSTAASPKHGVWYSLYANGGQENVQSIDFPTLLFLDPSLLGHGQVETGQLIEPVSTQILSFVGDMNNICLAASKFFSHIHLWMPFISKKRFYDQYLKPSFQARPDVVLLFLSLQLITTTPPADSKSPRTALYHTAKHFHLELEGSGLFTILILQAGVLLALYELGHGIYPAAYLTIGACARYAYALGIGAGSLMNKRRVLTRVEIEEQRRVWWSIVILDRFVSIGSPGRPFATAEPRFDDIFPTDDASWNEGIVKSNDSFPLSSPRAAHMSKFGLLCQAAKLLGQVLDSNTANNPENDAWMQLDRTMRSMLTASLNVECPDYDQITFVYSTLVALHIPWILSKSSSETDRSRHAKVVIGQISEELMKNIMDQNCFLDRDPEDLSPWGLFSAYQICRIHAPSLSFYNSDSEEMVQRIKRTFVNINARWKVAGVYLQILEAQEVNPTL